MCVYVVREIKREREIYMFLDSCDFIECFSLNVVIVYRLSLLYIRICFLGICGVMVFSRL